MSTLYYVMDPMCSWCWAFRPVLADLARALPAEVRLRYVMGGLAPDSEAPMPQPMREHLQQLWRAIAARTGARFNFDFWTRCTPRRSTWPACRAVIAAGLQDEARAAEMVHAIQRAYYLEARNPSELPTLLAIGAGIGLDAERLREDLGSARVQQRFEADLALGRGLGVQGFPTLVLEHAGRRRLLTQGYTDLTTVLGRLRSALSEIPETAGE